MRRIKVIISLAALNLFLTAAYLAFGATVVGSKHDLSDGSYNEPCAFCHTPHSANTAINAPLWNKRIDSSVSFQVYSSSTMNTVCANPPSGVSLACLSCHDGVNAEDLHGLVNAPGPGNPSYPGKCTSCHSIEPGESLMQRVGTDLTNDHPISMPYPTPAQDPFFHLPPDPQKGWGGSSSNDVKLFASRVECPSCHKVHDPSIAPFLRKSNSGSALCLTCHLK